jgi:hypothetical protein
MKQWRTMRRKKIKWDIEVNTGKAQEITAEQMASATVIPTLYDPDAKIARCWDNVAARVVNHGGKAVSGFFADDCGNFVELSAHDNWQDPDGNLWNITPGEYAVVPWFPHNVAGRGKTKVPMAYSPKNATGTMQAMAKADMRMREYERKSGVMPA